MRDNNPPILGIVCIIDDVTESEILKKDLINAHSKNQEQKMFFQTILDSTPDWIFVKDKNFKFIFVNESFANALGKEPKDFIGKDDIELGFSEELVFGNDNKGIKGFRNDDKLVLAGKNLHNTYDPATFSNGESHIFDTIKCPLTNKYNEVFAVLGYARDITELNEIQQVLIKKEAKLELMNKDLIVQSKTAQAANNAKTEFLANMSHELRTPLNGISLPCQILEKMDLTEKQKGFINTISISTDRLLNIINKVLDLTKIEKGEISIVNSNFNLAQVINNIKIIFIDKIKQKNLKFRLMNNINEDTNFYSDMNHIQQIIINLINNAIKFTREGEIVLEVAYKDFDGKLCLYCGISDTGIGISDENKSKLFKDFSQADSSITKEYGGSGLGLSISKKIITEMNGEIGFFSEENVGSMFYFHIPMEKSNTTNECSDITQSEIQFHNVKILVVDDDFINQNVLSHILKEKGCIIEIANNGQEAIDKIKENLYDIVLMDIQMPIMDGITAVKEIRKIAQFAELIIIAVTANAINGNKEKYLNAGMTDYIAKPVDGNTLINLIAEYISHKTRTKIKRIKKNTIIAKQYPGFDIFELQKMFSNNEDIVESIISKFKKNYFNIINDILELYKNSSTEELLKLVHKIKGSSGIVKATRFHEIIKELEVILKEDKSGFKDKLNELDNEWKIIIN